MNRKEIKFEISNFLIQKVSIREIGSNLKNDFLLTLNQKIHKMFLLGEVVRLLA